MLKIEYRELAKLKPNPKNPRKATEEDIKALAASIEQNPDFFEARPILLSDRTGEFVIIGGERRSEAAYLLKMKKVPTILFTGLTEAQEDEILIKDNTHSGTWDAAKLSKWNKDLLQSWNIDTSVIAAFNISKRNKEIAPESLKDDVLFRLLLSFDEYNFIKEALAKIDKDEKKALLKVLGYGL